MLLIGANLASAQNIVLECQFSVYSIQDYQCVLSGIEVSDPTANVTITGEHIGNRTNNDVGILSIFDSNTPFIIPQLFEAFPNLFLAEIRNSSLETIRFPFPTNLTRIYFRLNSISRIDAESFAGQTSITQLQLYENEIEVIDEDAFVGLEAITYVGLIDNNIREIAPATYHPLVNLFTLDYEGNQLTSIPDDAFIHNTRLTTVFFEYNQINEVSPTFSRNFAIDRWFLVNFSGNRCADRLFSVYADFDRTIFNMAMQQCFLNFVGDADSPRSASIQFTGNLTVFDDFNNVILRL